MDNELDYMIDDENDEELEKALKSESGEENESDDENEDENENKLIVEFKQPFIFEGETYTELNLEGLENLTGSDLMRIDKAYRKNNLADPYPDMSAGYAIALAKYATGKPIEFFKALPFKECRNIRNKVRSFLFN